MGSWEVGAIALAVAAATSPLVLHVVRDRFIDIPTERSSHTVPTPRGGGLAIIAGVAAGLIAIRPFPDAVMASFVTAILLGIVGLLEDTRGLSVSLRLALQTTVGLAGVIWVLASLDVRKLPFAVLVLVTLFWLIGFTNAFNFMDGINGISVAQLVVAGLAWVTIGTLEDLDVLIPLGAITAGSAIGFLPWNFPRARFFMGDVGSLFSGGWLAMLAITGVGMGVPMLAMLAPLIVYVADTTYTLIGRIRRGEDWLAPHRSHVYQRLVVLGWSHTKTTLFFTFVALTTAASGAVWLGDSIQLTMAGTAIAVVAVCSYLAAPYVVQNRALRNPEDE